MNYETQKNDGTVSQNQQSPDRTPQNAPVFVADQGTFDAGRIATFCCGETAPTARS